MKRYSQVNALQSSQSLLSSKIASEHRMPSLNQLHQVVIPNKKTSIQYGFDQKMTSSNLASPISPQQSQLFISKSQQMKQIEKEYQGYKKIKKQVQTQILTQHNEPIRERFNATVEIQPSAWEVERKQRILEGRQELNRKFKIQKTAITQYLSGEKVDNHIIKTHKEVVQPNPIQRAHNTPKEQSQPVFNFTQPLQTPAARSYQEGKFLYRSQKQMIQFNEQLKQPTTIQEKKRPKSALISMISPEFLKIGKKAKQDDPIKIKMKEYLEKFLKGEQNYFQILEKTKQEGSTHFNRSIQLSQKFYYDQINETSEQFNQADDLKTIKHCKILEHKLPSAKLSIANFNFIQDEQPPKKQGIVSWLDQESEDEREIEFEEQIATLESHYADQLQEQKLSLEELQQKLRKSKEGFEKNNNLPQKYQDFIKLIKRDDFDGVKFFIDRNPNIVNEAVDHIGLTGLHWAAKRGFKKIVQLLINQGANIFLVDVSGKTALEHALQSGQVKTSSLLQKEEAFLKAEKQVLEKSNESQQ